MTEILISEIKEITTIQTPSTILTQKMLKFDEIIQRHEEGCLVDFNKKCRNHPLLKRMTHLCEDMKLNLARLLVIEKNKYKDKLKFHIKAILIELNIGGKWKNFKKKFRKMLIIMWI